MIKNWTVGRPGSEAITVCLLTQAIKNRMEAGKGLSYVPHIPLPLENVTLTCVFPICRCYERKTRFRQPIVLSKLKQLDGTGRLGSIYSLLKCSDLKDSTIQCKLPPITPEKIASGGGGCGRSKTPHRGGGGGVEGGRGEEGGGDISLPKFEHTEQTLLPMLHQNRRVTLTTGTAGGRAGARC